MKKALLRKIRKEKTLTMMNHEREREDPKDFKHPLQLMSSY